jgi:Initiator Replication protein
MGYVSQKPANIGLRSQYALRLYGWAKRYVSVRTKRISLSLEQLRKVLGLESVKGPDGKIIHEAPLPVWANLRQRALDTAICGDHQENGRKHRDRVAGAIKNRRVTTAIFAIKEETVTETNSGRSARLPDTLIAARLGKETLQSGQPMTSDA